VLSLQRNSIMKRELIAAERIPYAAHVAGNLVKTVFGDYVQVFRLGGASFESADDDQLNTWHERLNVLWRNIASAQVALWAHVIRRREVASGAGKAGKGFADALNAKYRERLVGQTLMVNEWYLAVVYRPTSGAATGLVSKLLARTQRDGTELGLRDALTACEKLGQTLEASLARYEPEPLGVYKSGARVYSSLLEFLAYLINGEWQPMPLPRAPLFRRAGDDAAVFRDRGD
jgi:type IV secretion system protein VirB4